MKEIDWQLALADHKVDKELAAAVAEEPDHRQWALKLQHYSERLQAAGSDQAELEWTAWKAAHPVVQARASLVGQGPDKAVQVEGPN